MTVILLIVYMLFREQVKDWYRHQIEIMTTVSAYELGIYITLGVLALAVIVFLILNFIYSYADTVFWGIARWAYWLMFVMIIVGIVLGGVYEGWHWVFTILLIVYIWTFPYINAFIASQE